MSSMPLISRLSCWIFHSPRLFFVGCVLVLIIFKCGIGESSLLEQKAAMAANPFVNPFDGDKHYLFSTYLSPFLMWCLGLSSPKAFFYFHLVFAFLFTFLFARTAFLWLPDSLARISLIIFAALPASSTVYFWVGSDSSTLFLMMLALFFHQKSMVVLLIGILLGLQDFEKVALASGILLLCNVLLHVVDCQNKHNFVFSIGFALVLLLGVFLGKQLLLYWIKHFEIAVYSNRMNFVKDNTLWLIKMFFSRMHLSVYAALGTSWLVALWIIFKEQYGKIFALGLLCCFLVLLLALDHSRIFAMVSFLLLAQFVLFNRALLEKFFQHPENVVFFLCLWLIVPFMWILAQVYFAHSFWE